MLLQGWWQKVLEPQPVLEGTPAPRGTAALCWWHRWLLRAQGWQQLSWGTRKQEVMAGKKAAPSSGDIGEVTDGCGEECEWILVALRWLLLSGPSPQVICSAWPQGALCQLDGVCVEMSLTWTGDIPVPPAWPSWIQTYPGKAARDHYIHFWG